MDDLRITVAVEDNGTVRTSRLDTNEGMAHGVVGFTGLDAQLVALFEQWLTLRDRRWDIQEIRTFGSLLHRCLFPRASWQWIASAMHEAWDLEHRVRLELELPSEGAYGRLSMVPWEYLYRPDTDVRKGWFLATHPRLVLSRHIAGEVFVPPADAEGPVRILLIVSEPNDPRLGPVVAEDVVDTVLSTATTLGFDVQVLRNPTSEGLRAAAHTDGRPPELVHFMGHGEFDAARARASVALVDGAGHADWVDDRTLAEILSRDGRAPRVLVLHSCEGGRADFSAGFAGLAPQLVRSGVRAVVAMQYPVTNETAIDFSTVLYETLARGADLDEAVQEARWQLGIAGVARDPRLLGVPVVYLQSRFALVPAPAAPVREEHP